MSKHKAPTQVTIASTSDETLLSRLVDRYWKMAAGLALLVAGGILAAQWMSQQSLSAQSESWSRFGEDVTLPTSLFSQIQVADAAALTRLTEDLGDGPAAPWAKAFQIRALIDAGDQEAAVAAIEELETNWADHPLVRESHQFDSEGAPTTLPNHLRRRIHDVQQWEASQTHLFSNPAPAADAPRVKLNTSAGTIELALYPEYAPAHVENFLKLCREGFYDGTAFHRVIRDFMIQGGDPNSKDEDRSTWGQGDPGYTIPQEFSKLKHFRLALAMAKKPTDSESSGSQFYITTATPHHLDGVHTVFGVVVGGEDVVVAIETGPVEGDAPQNPVTIESAEVIEAAGE